MRSRLHETADLLAASCVFALCSLLYVEVCGSQENLSLYHALSKKPNCSKPEFPCPIQRTSERGTRNQNYSTDFFAWRDRKR